MQGEVQYEYGEPEVRLPLFLEKATATTLAREKYKYIMKILP